MTLNGMKRCEAHEHFNVSRGTINDWLQFYEETGEVKPRGQKHVGHSHKITDWSAFKAFVAAHSDKTQVEMAQLWPGEVSDRTISRALKKIGFT